MPARSLVSDGLVLDGEIITMPASLINGEAAAAAPEQLVPITPTTSSSATIICAAAAPPSAEQRSSSPVPTFTRNPLIFPKSPPLVVPDIPVTTRTARSFGRPRKATSPEIAFSERIWMSSPGSTRT